MDQAAMLERAEAQLRQGQFEEAIAQFAAMLLVAPRCWQARIGRGRALLELRRFEESRADLSVLIDECPDDPTPYVLRGECWRREGVSLQAAVSDYLSALQIDSADVHASVGIALTYVLQGHVELAVPHIADALVGDLRASALYSALVEQFIMQVEDIDAGLKGLLIRCCERLRLNPTDGEGYAARAKVLVETDTEAMSGIGICDWTMAIGLRPNDPALYDRRAAAWELRAISLEGTADFGRAADDYSRAGELAPTELRFYQKAVALYEAGRDAEALKEIDRLVRSHPERADYLSLRASVYEGMEQLEKARQDLDRTVEMCLSDSGQYASLPAEYYARGRIRAVLGDYHGAIEDLSQALSIEPQTNRMEILIERARAYQYLSEGANAIEDLTAATQVYRDSQSVAAYMARGRYHQDTGDIHNALQDYHHAARMNPTASEPLLAIATAYEELGLTDKVRATLQRVAAIDQEKDGEVPRIE